MDTLRPADVEVTGLEQRVRDLETCVERLSERLNALEASARTDLVPRSVPSSSPRADALSAQPPLPDAPAADAAPATIGWITLIGRTFLVLAGAYLLRALTDAGRLETTPGVWIGLAYAGLWLGLALRRGGRSGLVHGLTALMIALPLTTEATLRFHALGPNATAIVLSAIAFGALGVAWRRRLQLLALAALGGACVTSLITAIAMGAFEAPTLLIVTLGIVATWVAADRHWPVLAWPAAGAADMAALLLTVRASTTPPLDSPPAAMAIHALLAAGFLGTFLWRTRLAGRDAGALEMAQTAAVLGVALGDATVIAHAQKLDVRIIAAPALVAGAALYAYAYARVLPVRGERSQFYYVGMTAFALALAGLTLLFTYPVRPVVLAGASVVACLAAARRDQPLLALHGSIAGVAAAISGGLIALAGQVWLAHPAAWPAPGGVIFIVIASTLAALLIPRALRHEQPSLMAVVARLALAATIALGLGTIVVIGLGPFIAGTPPDAGILATERTVVLALATVGIAYGSRVPRFGELTWLTYGLLGLTAIKIVVEDFPVSSASTLFVALAAFGAALIVVPKVVKKA